MPDKPEDKKPEYVDLFEETVLPIAQRSAQRVVIEPAIKDKRRLSHWPPAHLEEWRAETLTPWRLRSRKRDWS
ncbi:hypothetical protein [Bradyrhizobium sp.]|jgi:hypothetical protein|uniref:hypothetical protein n=1 Tax=Bradyrhizobium sp. TaxID=376 RepID=UPI002CBD28D9|nr:hypothetical protein [Bradyrhizobium sp.]HWX60426.1 hypothetical protein [Bradyrhizobium sp.]